MGLALAIFVWLSFLGGLCVGAAWVGAIRLASEADRPRTTRWLWGWSIKGLLLPVALWSVMNFGISWDLPAFMPQVQQAQNSSHPWLPTYLRVVSQGICLISSHWMAVTLVWALARLSPSLTKETRSKLKGLCWTAVLVCLLPALGLLFVGGWPMLGMAAGLVLLPIAAYAPELIQPPKRSPLYARAIAKIKFGKYAEAEWEIIRELERCEDDFDGWMMMAELYADHFHDLGEAEQTILDICSQPKTTASQISIALHKLADWQLKMTGDPDGARRCLQIIRDRCPGSHLARMAQLRINQLPHSARELLDQRAAQPIPLPALGNPFDEAPARPESQVERNQAAELARDYVRILEKDPDYVPAREKLARLLAERLDQPDQAIEQLVLLLEMDGQLETHRAEWLSLMAAWHMKYRQDADTAASTLARVVSDFPNTPQAIAARHRLRLLEEEKKAKASKPPPTPGNQLVA